MRNFGKFVVWLLSIIILFLIVGAIVMIAYNATMPYIFGLPEINLAQGFLLFALSQFLFASLFNVNIHRFK